MTPWAKLAVRIGEERADAARLDWRSPLLSLVHRIAELGHCSRTAIGWLRPRTVDGREQLSWSENSDGATSRHRAVRLIGLTHLEDDALLTVLVTSDRRRRTLVYSMGLQGVLREGGRRWYARIDLDDAQKGTGPCCHPLLHCHVGEDPETDPGHGRVPLPWLSPVEAVQWLLATAEPSLEPQDIAR